MQTSSASPDSETAKRRRRLVRDLERRALIRSPAVRDAFSVVPRELFLREFAAREGLSAVYRDEAIPTKFDTNGFAISSSSQPAIMAEMLEQLALEPGMRVLEIGAGTGYNAALLAHILGPKGSVTAIDIDPQIARAARAALRHSGYRVRVVAGDGHAGFAERAPYDRIIVTASSDTVPRAWFEQLAEGGLVEAPLRITSAGAQVIPTLRKQNGRLVSDAVVCGGFMPLRSPGDSAPQPQRSPCLIATDSTREQGKPLRQLTGSALSTLSTATKRRLLAVALTEGRRRPLGLRARSEALVLYLTLTLPPSHAVTLFPGWTIGTISRDGCSLAYIESQAHLGKPWVSYLTAHGGNAAEAALLDAVREWDRRGRPGPNAMSITVSYKQKEAKLHYRWRARGRS